MEETAIRSQAAFSRHRWFLLLLLLSVAVLSGCKVQEAAEETLPAVTVRFLAQGEVISQQEVENGGCPEAVEFQAEGLDFGGWKTADGQTATPESSPVSADTDYIAVLYPSLSYHVPYLFPDENGFIRPDDILTADELALAIRMLAEEAAWQYLPNLPSGSAKETTQTLDRVLEHYFPPEAVSAAFAGVEEGQVTRSAFAQIMNRLLGRSGETVQIIYGELPRDLALDRKDCADVLEAALRHVQDSNGWAWADAVMEAEWEPGFFNLEGWLYWVDETGHIVRDAQVGTLTFGSDGRFTSGDEELDAMTAEILWGIIKENPGLEGIELLRKVYEATRDGYTYLRKAPIDFGATGWEIQYAKVMMSGGLGNCYNYAATFWALSRGLGYETRAISGRVGKYSLPHGWTEVTIDGVVYICDPELEMAYRYRGFDLFMKTYAQVPERKYTPPKTDG